MKDKYNKLPLRSGVGIVVLNKENRIFVIEYASSIVIGFWLLKPCSYI